jgi:hypothetical protein
VQFLHPEHGCVGSGPARHLNASSEPLFRKFASSLCIHVFVRFKVLVNRSVDKMQPQVSAPTANTLSRQLPPNHKGGSLDKWTVKTE